MKKVSGRAALVIGAVLIALAIGETFFRMQPAAAYEDDGEWRERYRHMNETIYRRSDDPALVYEPVPGASVDMEYGAAGFNSAGMRDDREPPAQGETITLLGDSIAWSEFMPLSDSLGRQIERATGTRVLNFGVTGYDTTQEARWYERARSFRSRTVVLVFCMNDLMIMSGPFERFANPSDRARKTAQERHIERTAPVRRETIDGVIETRERDASIKVLARASSLYTRWRFASSYVDEHLVSFRDRAARARTRRAIGRLGRAIRADGARAVFVISPVLESWDDYHWQPIHAWARDAAEDAGFDVVDPIDTWRGEEDPSEMRIDNLHYDPSGNTLLAERIAEALE
jgi:lysophospholipase L1-like esterase